MVLTGAATGKMIDGPAVTAAWERALESPAWDGAPVWIHGDLIQAVALIPYYAVTSPAFSAVGRRTVDEILADR